MEIEFILYVADQKRSTLFYQYILGIKPILNVPGMTEFMLGDKIKLGLMPENGIAKILTPITSHPNTGNGIPRCELYLKMNDPENYMKRSIEKGAILISKLKARDWGDTVGYIADLDGHIIAFVEQ